MRLVRYYNKALFYAILLVVTLTISLRVEQGKGNPIPWDENWELAPIPTDYIGPIYFSEEHIQVNFTETQATVNASYTFTNLNETKSNLTVYLPFINYDNISQRPVINIIKADGIIVEYEWQELGINLSTVYTSTWGYEQFYLIELNLQFETNETKELQVDYVRDYMKYDYPSNSEIHYEYRYFVGSLRLWNQPLDSAKFEFWIPTAFCDSIQKPWNSDKLGENITELHEYEDYYYLSVRYENWTLPPRTEDKSLYIINDFISVRWTKNKIGIFGTPYNIFLKHIILLTILWKKKRKSRGD
ncbi:MAG: hypothetical protein ACFFAU_00380 [Candidatus Hodarchaeota archaeon]